MKYCDICHSRKATIGIQIYGRGKIDMVYSCKSCAKMFADPLCSCKSCADSNKKPLEHQVVEPACSNANSVSVTQQHEVQLND